GPKSGSVQSSAPVSVSVSVSGWGSGPVVESELPELPISSLMVLVPSSPNSLPSLAKPPGPQPAPSKATRVRARDGRTLGSSGMGDSRFDTATGGVYEIVHSPL